MDRVVVREEINSQNQSGMSAVGYLDGQEMVFTVKTKPKPPPQPKLQQKVPLHRIKKLAVRLWACKGRESAYPSSQTG